MPEIRFPIPDRPAGYWRRIILVPMADQIVAGLEDDFHRFHLRLLFRDGHITEARAEALRFPWSSCPGGAPFIGQELKGRPITEIAALSPPDHCTHLRDLAILAAGHAGGRTPKCFDMLVSDHVDGRFTATLIEDGAPALHWQMEDTLITAPAEYAGRDLRALSRWKQELSPDIAERAGLLRRAIFVSNGRAYAANAGAALTTMRASDAGPSRMGACFTYQMPRAQDACRLPEQQRDFSCPGNVPLAGFDPEQVLATPVRDTA